jgi:protein-tyrosine phosphatase
LVDLQGLNMDPRSQVFPITNAIWLGPFASPERKSTLIAGNVTHILNVGEAPSVLQVADGPFRAVKWQSVTDLELLPERTAIRCLTLLHDMVSEVGGRVYVHCIAGQNRSPTIVWLYLVACGVSPIEAKAIVEQRAPDAIAGHSKLVNEHLVVTVQKVGAEQFLPHPRPEAVFPVPLSS